jgi:hypothetical protein
MDQMLTTYRVNGGFRARMRSLHRALQSGQLRLPMVARARNKVSCKMPELASLHLYLRTISVANQATLDWCSNGLACVPKAPSSKHAGSVNHSVIQTRSKSFPHTCAFLSTIQERTINCMANPCTRILYKQVVLMELSGLDTRASCIHFGRDFVHTINV